MKAELEKETVSKETILEQLNWRYATKGYDKTRQVSAEDWETLETALTLAPSSFGIQPYKFIVITDPELREKLKPAAYGQAPITDASHLVVFAYKKTLTDADIEHFVDRIVEVRGTPREALTDYENIMKGSAKQAVDGGYIEVWNSRQAYIALGFLLETAALLGIDATPMEGFDAAQFNEILGLTDYSAVALAAVGYRDAENDWLANLAKVRFPKDELIDRR
ncbi:MAG TPA: NAD(P)H-dependent oxidoreductase [Pyrinomonadaceae bacterium]|jgi:nitroreductase|nr:NAD(P)H-dependent oxidoreductase [Pyrinomonadaceae bacterium]